MSTPLRVNYLQTVPGSYRPTLYGLRQQYPALFYPQTWFDGEAFMYVPLPDDAPTTLPGVADLHPEWPGLILPRAVELAALYVAQPGHAIWGRYLWTRDTDADGQRVFVGDNGKGLEIHRHLAITERWGVPCWP